MPIVALAADFLEAFARLPRAQQKKVRTFTEKFQAHPTAAAINYEKIHTVRDPHVRTVRIDQKYRAVVLHPDQGDVYVLVWVDHHDAAMAWAAQRTFEIHPHTGALQIVRVEAGPQAGDPAPPPVTPAALLARFDDELLLSFGIPAVLLPAVRAVQTPAELVLLAPHLPAEAAEALVWLAEGVPPGEVRAAVAPPAPLAPVDTQDLARALEHLDSRRRFVTLHTDAELTAMLDAPLAKWRVFLHPSQERLVRRTFTGPARVTGGAGTGKTVVAMHRAHHLATTHCPAPHDRILCTTYTANLAQNIAQNLQMLGSEAYTRIEVVHLHAWAVRFLRAQGITCTVASAADLETCWAEALQAAEAAEFDVGFVRQEWEQVVQAHGIASLADYLKVVRLGRGRTLTRLQRPRLWQVFDQYQAALRRRGQCDWLSVIQQARRVLEQHQAPLPYRAVIVDEAQDFHRAEWELIRALVPSGPNDLFIVGDAHQRIYGQKVALRQCGIAIQGRASRLRINYRTTEQIRAWAMALMHGLTVDNLDGALEPARGYTSLLSGPPPEVYLCATRAEERACLGQHLQHLLTQYAPEDLCLVTRLHTMLREEYQPLLQQLGLRHTLLDRHQEGPGIRLATMHRVKGLEFPVMILAGINAQIVPLQVASVASDPVSQAEHEERERALLFTAATRARDRLLVTSWGNPSPFLLVESGSNA